MLEIFNIFVNNEDASKIKDIFEKYILSSYSYYDLGNEKNYQILTLGILSVVFENYLVKSEVNNSYGRCDIMISPKKGGNDMGIILEIKYSKTKLSKTRLKLLADKAIEQIEKHKYYEELKNRNLSNIVIYGFAFNQNQLAVSYKQL